MYILNKKVILLLQIFVLICSIKSYLSSNCHTNFSFSSLVYAWIFHPLLLLFCKNRDECFCGNSLTRRVIHDSEECTETCKGNSREGCGGPWRVAVYKNPSHKQSKYLELLLFFTDAFENVSLLKINQRSNIKTKEFISIKENPLFFLASCRYECS